MKTLYVVSFDMKGGGADYLAPDLTAVHEYIQSLKKNKIKGLVHIYKTEVTVSDFEDFMDDSTCFFDNIEDYNLQECAVYRIGTRTKSKADLDKQIGRIFDAHNGHRLYMKAQKLVLRYNFNMSNSPQNISLHERYMRIRSTNTDKADELLMLMQNVQYPIDIYAVPGQNAEPETRIYNNVNGGDWVGCTFCGNVMLLPHGADCCPECGKDGQLKWVDDARPEMHKQQLRKTSFVDRKLELRNVFTQDAIIDMFPLAWARIQKGETVYI